MNKAGTQRTVMGTVRPVIKCKVPVRCCAHKLPLCCLKWAKCSSNTSFSSLKRWTRSNSDIKKTIIASTFLPAVEFWGTKLRDTSII